MPVGSPAPRGRGRAAGRRRWVSWGRPAASSSHAVTGRLRARARGAPVGAPGALAGPGRAGRREGRGRRGGASAGLPVSAPAPWASVASFGAAGTPARGPRVHKQRDVALGRFFGGERWAMGFAGASGRQVGEPRSGRTAAASPLAGRGVHMGFYRVICWLTQGLWHVRSHGVPRFVSWLA